MAIFKKVNPIGSIGTNARDPNYKDPQAKLNHKIFVNGKDVTDDKCKKVKLKLSKKDLEELTKG